MASVIYNNAKYLIATDQLNLVNDVTNIILVSGYSPDVDNDVYLSAVGTYEISGTGYVSGGIPLTTKSLIIDSVNDRVILSADDPDWGPTSYLSATGAVIYKQVLYSPVIIETNWQIGVQQDIQWNFQDVLSDVSINLSIDNGDTWSYIISDTPNTGFYNWIPTSASYTSAALIKIQGLIYTDPIDGSVIDFSDIYALSNIFSITNNPNVSGFSYTDIDYTSSPLISYVDFGETFITSGNDFAIGWSEYEGVLFLT